MAGSASVHIPFTATDGISPKIGRINKSMAGLSKNTIKSGTAIGTAMGTFVGGIAIRAFDALTGQIGGAINKLGEQDKLLRRTENVLQTTGGAANTTANDILSMSSSLEMLTGVEQESIQNGQNLLLTFTKIQNKAGTGNDIFDRATKSMVDLSVAMGGDVQGASIQLGKALNDPIRGMTAMTRSGVSFTQEQKNQVKALQESGDMLGAQKIILDELEIQFGGAGKAAGESFAGQMAILGHIVTGLIEDGLRPLLPIIIKVAKFITGTVVPAVQKFAAAFARTAGPAVDKLMEGAFAFVAMLQKDVIPTLLEVARNVGPVLASAFGTLGDILSNNVLPAVQGVFGFLAENKEAVLAITAGIVAMIAAFKTYQMVMTAVQTVMKAYAIIQGIVNIVMSANPVGIIVLAIIGLIAAFAALYASSEGFRDAVGGLFSALGAAFDFVIGLIRTIIGFFWNGPMGIIIKAIAGLAGIDLSGVDRFINGGDAPGTGGTGTSANPMNDKYGGKGATTVNVQIGNEQLVPTVTRVMGSTANAGTGRRSY
jgi:hypothetical protein